MRRWIAPIILILFSIIGLILYGPIAQDHAYHNFADQRCICNINNTFNVLTNIPFLFIGLWGLIKALKIYKQSKDTGLYGYIAFFIGITATSFGSSYYHWEPTNITLIWDRLAMTIAFMALFNIVMAEQVSRKAAQYLLAPFLMTGVATIYYWHITQDLRPYLLVQFLPMILIPLFTITLPCRRYFKSNILMLIATYGASKVTELYDKEIFIITSELISGHSLKHLIAAAAVIFVIRALPYEREY